MLHSYFYIVSFNSLSTISHILILIHEVSSLDILATDIFISVKQWSYGNIKQVIQCFEETIYIRLSSLPSANTILNTQSWKYHGSRRDIATASLAITHSMSIVTNHRPAVMRHDTGYVKSVRYSFNVILISIAFTKEFNTLYWHLHLILICDKRFIGRLLDIS